MKPSSSSMHATGARAHHGDEICDFSPVRQVTRGSEGDKKKRDAGHGPTKRRREPVSHVQIHGVLAFAFRTHAKVWISVYRADARSRRRKTCSRTRMQISQEISCYLSRSRFLSVSLLPCVYCTPEGPGCVRIFPVTGRFRILPLDSATLLSPSQNDHYFTDVSEDERQKYPPPWTHMWNTTAAQ